MAIYLRYIIILFLLGEYVLTRILAYLNQQSWAAAIPAELAASFTPESHDKARAYSRDKYYLGLITTSISLLLSLVFLLGGGYAWIDDCARGISAYYIVQGWVFWGITVGITMLVDLPFEWYTTFVLEQRYGFNKTTISTFVLDKLKGILLAIVIGGAVYALLAWLFQALGDWFWIAGWIVVSAITLFFAAFYTSLILPLFNQLTPLEDGPLRTQIEQYARAVSFPLTNIMLMDGSKRSNKANAFFIGLGNSKSIVLYDTLVHDMSVPEVVSVLAHEVGHYQHKHIRVSMVLNVVQMGLMFMLFGMIARQPYMAEALGASQNSFYLSLITFTMLYSPISMLLGIGMNVLSRKHEYEADAYAASTYHREPTVSALLKLYINHLDQPSPSPAYVFVHYSHPTLLERIRALADK
jgi:STE24 endopeptidase